MFKKISFIALIQGFLLFNASAQPVTGRLSPLPAKTAGKAIATLPLNGEWEIRIGENAPRPIQVPGEWEMQGFTIAPGETGVYSRKLDIPKDWENDRVYIRFDGVSAHAVVKINGKKVAEHEGSFVPFEADITEAVLPESNVLTVEVQANTISDILACTSQYAVHTVGGLLRKVTLFTLPQVNISDITVTTTFDKAFKNAWLGIKSSIASFSPANSKAQLRYTLVDGSNRVVFQKAGSPIRLDQEHAQIINDSFWVNTPAHWTPETPSLYLLTAELEVDGKPVYTVRQRVGFRQVRVAGNELLVNGRPVKLRGVNRHSVHPLMGRAISDALDRKDAELFRAANCNYIRTSHYPPSEAFLEACDELGLFVESEASLTWIDHHASPVWKHWNYTDKKFLPYMMQANIDNVRANKNHPSVIIWSLGNESRWSPLWAEVNTMVKRMDPTRPTSFHDQCWGGFNNAGSMADIANYHYPGINGPAATDTMRRPVLFGEYAHVSTYNRRELLTDPGIRDAYNAPLVQFYDSMYYHKGNLGGAIWSGIDDIFHLPDGRIVGYGPWGLIDGWRREKPEYWGMKKAYAPVRVTNVNWSAVVNGYVELTVENRYDFTSFKDVKIEATVDGVTKQLISSIPPRSKGFIKVPAMKNARTLCLSFSDPRGFIANKELFENIPSTEEQTKAAAVSYTENELSISVQQGNVTWLISKLNGVITSVKKNRQVLLTQGPVFCIVPMNSEDGGKPNVAGETYQNNIYPLKNYPLYTLYATEILTRQTERGLSITMKTAYSNAKGKQSYLFTTDGNLITEYEVLYEGSDVHPYQYGLLMQLPMQFDKLSWKRKGAFTVYPDYDISRNEGTAMMNARKINGVEEWGVVPKGHWKDDTNELGSNDFRSTKRFILRASLEDKDGRRITALSNAKQSSRSWLQDERIQWLITDYSNNGSEPFYGSPYSDGRITIKKDQVLKGKLILTVHE